MTILVIVAVCVVLAVLAFLLPRLSREPQRGVDATLGAGQRAGRKAPGILGDLLPLPFRSSRKAANRSASGGRRARRRTRSNRYGTMERCPCRSTFYFPSWSGRFS